MSVLNTSGFNYINWRAPGVIVARVDFDGTTYTVNTPYADTTINSSLAGKTTAELLEIGGREGGFAGDNGAIYRKAGAAGTTAIKIAKVITTSIVGAHIEIVTGLTTSTRNLSLGTTLQAQSLLGYQPTDFLTAGKMVVPLYSSVSSFPGRSSTTVDCYAYFNPDVIVAAGTDIVLYLDATDATVITQGSIDIHIRFGSISVNSRPVSKENQNSRGIRFGSVIPIF